MTARFLCLPSLLLVRQRAWKNVFYTRPCSTFQPFTSGSSPFFPIRSLERHPSVWQPIPFVFRPIFFFPSFPDLFRTVMDLIGPILLFWLFFSFSCSFPLGPPHILCSRRFFLSTSFERLKVCKGLFVWSGTKRLRITQSEVFLPPPPILVLCVPPFLLGPLSPPPPLYSCSRPTHRRMGTGRHVPFPPKVFQRPPL